MVESLSGHSRTEEVQTTYSIESFQLDRIGDTGGYEYVVKGIHLLTPGWRE